MYVNRGIFLARINIENSLFSDSRFQDLIVLLQNKHAALGVVAGSWVIAQKYWIEFKCVPKKSWPKDLQCMIDVGLAERLENGDVYVCGSKHAFAWLEQRVDAGRRGGLKNKSKNSNQNKEAMKEATAKRPVSETKRDRSLLSPTPTLSLKELEEQKIEANEIHKILFKTFPGLARHAVQIVSRYQNMENFKAEVGRIRIRYESSCKRKEKKFNDADFADYLAVSVKKEIGIMPEFRSQNV